MHTQIWRLKYFATDVSLILSLSECGIQQGGRDRMEIKANAKYFSADKFQLSVIIIVSSGIDSKMYKEKNMYA